MKLKRIKYIFFLLLIILTIFLASCREDIVPPGNPVGSDNQPVSFNQNDLYTFLIDAKNISLSKIEYPRINSTESSLYVSISNYESGYVTVRVVSESKEVLLYKIYNSNLEGTTFKILGNVPHKLEIGIYNFTGNLKIQLTSY